MNFKTTFILIVAVLAIGGLWFLTKDQRPARLEPEDDSAQTPPVFADAPGASRIVRVKVERPGQPTMEFEREAPQTTLEDATVIDVQNTREWRMVSPVECAAQGVDELVNPILTLTATPATRSKESVDDKEAGLEPPLASVELTDTKGQKYALDLGAKLPLSDRMFVRRPADKTLLIAEADLTRQLKRGVNEFRARRLLAFKPAEAQRITLTTGDQAIELERDGTQWMLRRPVESRAENAKVTEILNKLSYFTVADFVDDAPPSPATYGFDRPFQTIELTVQPAPPPVLPPASAPATAPAPITYAVHVADFADNARTKRFIKLADRPWVANVRVNDLTPLTPSLTDLRDRLITRVQSAEARKLEITTAAGQTASLQFVDGQWKGDGDLDQVDRLAVSDLLQAFETVRAVEYVANPGDLAQYGLDNPRASLTVTTADDRRVTLALGDLTRGGQHAYARRNDEPEVLVITQQQAAALAVAPLTLRSREIFVAPGGAQIRSIEAQDAWQTTRVVKDDSGAWQLESPEGATMDRAAADSIANELSRLRAKRVVARDAAGDYGLASPPLTLTFGVRTPVESSTETGEAASQPAAPQWSEPQLHTLRLAMHQSNYYAVIDDQPWVFELDQSIYRLVTGELLQRKLFSFAADAIKTIRSSNRGDVFEFERAEEAWKYAADPYLKVTKSKVDELVRTFAGLNVDDVVKWNGATAEEAGLTDDAVTLVATTAEGESATLRISPKESADGTHDAVWVEGGRWVRLRAADVESLTQKLEKYLDTQAQNQNTAAPSSFDLGG
jgi:hypothetical protein